MTTGELGSRSGSFGYHDPGLADAELMRLMDSSPDGILVVGDDGTVRYANSTSESLLATEPGGLVGTVFGFPLCAETDELIDVRQPDGTLVTAQMRVTRVSSEGEPQWVVALRAAPTSLRSQASVDAEIAGMAQERDDTLAVTSHELRNPMAALSGYVDLLVLDWERLTDEARHRHLLTIQRVARRLQTVVSRFLHSAQLEAGLFTPYPQPTRVIDVLLEGLPELGNAAADLDLRVPGDCVVNAHPDHLWSIVSNGIVNAFRHGAPPVVVTVERDRSAVLISVLDHGAGVAPESAERLFARYVRGVPENGPPGTGLGLWIARSIARAYGGDVWYEPHDGPGAWFRCRLPSATMGPTFPSPR